MVDEVGKTEKKKEGRKMGMEVAVKHRSFWYERERGLCARCT